MPKKKEPAMIYESPDGGATVYARPINGKGERVLIEEPKYPEWHLNELEISEVVDYANEGNKSLQIQLKKYLRSLPLSFHPPGNFNPWQLRSLATSNPGNFKPRHLQSPAPSIPGIFNPRQLQSPAASITFSSDASSLACSSLLLRSNALRPLLSASSTALSLASISSLCRCSIVLSSCRRFSSTSAAATIDCSAFSCRSRSSDISLRSDHSASAFSATDFWRCALCAFNSADLLFCNFVPVRSELTSANGPRQGGPLRLYGR